MIWIKLVFTDILIFNERFIAFLVCIFMWHNCMAQTQREIELERQINKVIQSFPIAGIAVSVIDADSIFYMKGFGFSNLDKIKPYTTQTIQNIASISKTTIGISLMKAEELGLLKLDDPINEHLPFPIQNPGFKNDEITLLQLATHTSSIKDRSSVYDLKCYRDINEPIIRLKDFVYDYFNPKGKWYNKNNFSEKKPGTAYEYSNVGAALAAYIIEYQSGMSYSEFTEKFIFEPLQMNNTVWFFNEIDSSKHSTLYNSDLKERKLYQLITYPDGGLRTCVDDLSKYFQMILKKGKFNNIQIIEKESVEKMTKPRYDKNNLPKNFELINQGIFWEIEWTRLTNEMEGHSGGDPGVITMMYYMPDFKKGIIYVANTQADKKNMDGYNEIWRILVEYAKKL